MNDTIIKTVMTHPNVCSYFDIPVQHVSESVLKKMVRAYTPDDLFRLFDKIRSIDPDAVLRTTLIVGFPGETSKDFEQLLAFVKNIRFDHLGAFIYSDSADLPAHRLSGHVPEKWQGNAMTGLCPFRQRCPSKITEGTWARRLR